MGRDRSKSTPSFKVLKRELKQLQEFYSKTRFAYNQVSKVMDAAASSDEFMAALKSEDISWNRNEAKTLSEHHKLSAENVLRELLFVRTISALETFLVDAIRDIFVVTKTPFMDKSVQVSMTQEELIANNSPMKIYNKIIYKETRRLTSGGFDEFIKYYKKRFDIDLSAIHPGYKRMNEYHDSRHILVHRLGRTDEAFRHKYHTDIKKIIIHPEYLLDLLKDVISFAGQVDQDVRQLIQSNADNDSTYDAKYIVDILILRGNVPNCLLPSFQYWADDEYVMMSDVILGTRPAENGMVRYYFNGSNRALRYLHRYLKREQKKRTISVNEITNAVRFEKNYAPVPEHIIQAVLKDLPPQPWDKGIHKITASNLGLSNGIVSRAIDALIKRRVLKDQIDGKLVD